MCVCVCVCVRARMRRVHVFVCVCTCGHMCRFSVCACVGTWCTCPSVQCCVSKCIILCVVVCMGVVSQEHIVWILMCWKQVWL